MLNGNFWWRENCLKILSQWVFVEWDSGMRMKKEIGSGIDVCDGDWWWCVVWYGLCVGYVWVVSGHGFSVLLWVNAVSNNAGTSRGSDPVAGHDLRVQTRLVWWVLSSTLISFFSFLHHWITNYNLFIYIRCCPVILVVIGGCCCWWWWWWLVVVQIVFFLFVFSFGFFGWIK